MSGLRAKNNLDHYLDIRQVNKGFNQQKKTHIKYNLKKWSGWNGGGADETTKQLSSTLEITQVSLSGARAECARRNKET